MTRSRDDAGGHRSQSSKLPSEWTYSDCGQGYSMLSIALEYRDDHDNDLERHTTDMVAHSSNVLVFF